MVSHPAGCDVVDAKSRCDEGGSLAGKPRCPSIRSVALSPDTYRKEIDAMDADSLIQMALSHNGSQNGEGQEA
jgi:hypothetical protein